MRETEFIKQNQKKWRELERLKKEKTKDPALMSELFVEVTNDLSYSKSYYPNRSIKVYLNNLALDIHSSIYKNRRATKKRVKEFWGKDLPLALFEARYNIYVSFLIFAVAVAIGVFSSIQDPGFPAHILGDDYIEMTKTNIDKDDPMAVYKDGSQMDNFFMFMLWNSRIDFLCFVLGITLCIGTIVVLIYNGVMVGVFQFFFYERGLFEDSFLTIWMHGTPEMMAAVLSGAAGITLGRGLLFPGTFPRKQSFLISARRGIMVLLGVVPLTLYAAFIEGFITRYTEVPNLIRAVIILSTGALIIYYFVVYPIKVYGRKNRLMTAFIVSMVICALILLDWSRGEDFLPQTVFWRRNFLFLALTSVVFIRWKEIKRSFISMNEDVKNNNIFKIPQSMQRPIRWMKDKRNAEIYTDVFSLYSNTVFGMIPLALLLTVVYISMVTNFMGADVLGQMYTQTADWWGIAVIMAFIKLEGILQYEPHFLMYFVNCGLLAVAVAVSIRNWSKSQETQMGVGDKQGRAYTLVSLPWIILIVLIGGSIHFLPNVASWFLMMLAFPILIPISCAITFSRTVGISMSESIQLSLKEYGRNLGLFCMVYLTALVFILLFNSGLLDFLLSSLLENFKMQDETYALVLQGFQAGTSFFSLFLLTPLFIYAAGFAFLAQYEINTAVKLKQDIADISITNRAYGLVKE